MVEIINKTDVQYVYYPKTQNSTGPYTLHIHSELSQKDWHFENVEDKASLHDYYKFYLDYSNVDNGEFDYQIISNEEVMDTGLLRIGIGQASVKGYDTPNEIIQYDMYGAPTERYQHKSVSATSNGTYNVLPDEGYAALSEVDIYVNVPSDSGASYESGYTQGYESGYTQGSEDGYDSGYTQGTADGYDSGYTSGKTDGIAEQKAKLVATAVTENGTYSRPDGYSSIQVSIPQTGHTDEEMQQAYASGQTYQKSLLVSTAVTSNGTYSRPNGYSSFVVNVPSDSGTGYNSGYTDGYNSGYTQGSEDGYGSGYTSGKTDGIAEQKAKLISTAFTQNGTYTRNDGWNSVVIDVSGYTEQDLLDAFNSGYTNGYNSGNTDGYDSGWTNGYNSGYTNGFESGETFITGATAISLNVASAITDMGQASYSYGPSTAIIDPLYSSSDDSIATIDNSGTILALSSGTVNICVTDRNSGLYDCESVDITATQLPSGYTTPLTFDIISGGTILWVASADSLPIEYSINGGEWTSISSTTAGTAINVEAGDVVRCRGDNYRPSGELRRNRFVIVDAKVNLKGNPMSLMYSTDFVKDAYALSSDAFRGLFMGNDGIIRADEMVIPSVGASYCYYGMFSGCTSLTTAPALPATTLANSCYVNMFAGCTSLTAAPALPATTLASNCYTEMFAGCTGLTTAPVLSGIAVTSDRCCENMFSGCTSLTGVPSSIGNSATTLSLECYAYMFQGCTSLTTAPVLPATNLASYCYWNMFRGCTSLKTAPSLPATTLASNCYHEMFRGCTSLTTAPELPATTLATSCYYGMFSGCTSLTQVLELPATTLTEYCYYSMFNGCTSLTAAPELPATTLTEYCYVNMFQGCTSLNYIKCLAKYASVLQHTNNWVNGVASSGTFVKHPDASWSSGVSGIPNNWTVIDAQ